jgi:acetyl-CoA synthetase
MEITVEMLVTAGLSREDAEALHPRLAHALRKGIPLARWRSAVSEVLHPGHPFAVHRLAFDAAYADQDPARGPAPAWVPDPETVMESNLGRLIAERGKPSYREFFAWAARDREAFWEVMLGKLGIVFRREPERILDPASGVTAPRWLPGAELNIAESCFRAEPSATAIVRRAEGGPTDRWTYADLEDVARRVAAGLVALGFRAGDRIAVDIPMTAESVAVYLGIVLAGMAVVSIADSFAPEEIATRLTIADAAGIFTQDVIPRGGKALPLYEKVAAAGAPRAVVLAAGRELAVDLRDGDSAFADFLPGAGLPAAVAAEPDAIVNVLFSSGTTGDPKAIPWTQTTPIKCAADGWLHQDIRPGSVVAWPTNLGWMMGPWLIFATLVNRGTIALYEGAPGTRGFCEFVQDAGVNVLGLVPSLVRAWRAGGMTEGLDWSAVRAFSSTGECSSPDDMLWLMSRAGYRPVIEYCGGTEIGGGYITGTVVQPCAPATFTTPALGLDLVILDEEGGEAEEGEVFLVPPSIGLSTSLLNRDHHEVYHEGTPKGPQGQTLRRHGDRVERLPHGFFRAQGRADDTMNLSGIKVSSAELERVLDRHPAIEETAVVAVPPPGGGPDRLFVFAVLTGDAGAEPDALRADLQAEVREHLNPLFRVHEVRIVDALPRTASAKVMRRVLREMAEG